MDTQTNKKYSVRLKNYFAPTPKLFRMIGDTLLSLGSLMTGYQIVCDEKTLALISLTLTILGKFMTNLASLDVNETTN
jgi:hypothetical protein